MSAEQRAKLSATQRAYVANDPRWEEHRRKLAAANEAHRRTLAPEEVPTIVGLRRDGYSYGRIADEIGICEEVIARELKALNISPARPVSAELRAKLSANQKNIVATNRRMTLYPNEVEMFLELRKKGRTISYISEEIGISEKVLVRELRALNVSTARIKPDRRPRRGAGFWRSFDE
jgi:DNA-binding NarL/FixJ family response regulator